MKPIKSFNGLHNVSDKLRLGLGWLDQADNIDITDTGGIVKREGYSRALTGAFTSAFSTADFSHMYVVDGGALKAMAGQSTAVTLQTGLSTAPMHWAEINDQVFFNNGTDAGIINPDNEVLVWRWGSPPAGDDSTYYTYRLADGRMTGVGSGATGPAPAGAALVKFTRELQTEAGEDASAVFTNDQHGDLMTAGLDALPFGVDVIQAWKGRIYAAQYFPEADQTALWFSQPLGFHLFDLAKDVVLVSGRILMLAPTDDALLIGTASRIYAYDNTKLETIAPYGVVPGQHWSADDGRTFFWSTRGLCSALPFKNMTDRHVSVAPGVRAGGAVVQQGGQRRYVVAIQQGGQPFNAY